MPMATISRRRVLRGMLAGGAVSVALPILDCLLNDNGSAFADTGSPIPLRFATWFWSLGFGEHEWTPKDKGTAYELPPQLESLKPLQKKMNLFSGGQVFLDGHVNETHFTGGQGLMTGRVGPREEYFGSIDTLVGEVIGNGTRFRSLEASCDGQADCWSARVDSGKVPAEVSPLALYMRIFGPEYKDPNAAEFVPDPQVLLRRSALSVVSDQRKDLIRTLGTSDRAKLDNYFTSLRAMEQKLTIQLQKPEPLSACTKPVPPDKDRELTTLASDAIERHSAFANIMAHALACGQTRVVNLVLTSGGASGLRMTGDTTSHHTYTHEEAIDPVLGYQPKCAWFTTQYMRCLSEFATILNGIQEGDKSLLDRMIVFAFTEHGAPRMHSLLNYPVITLGSGSGHIRTGMHIAAVGDAVTRVGLTVQQAMGVPVSSWGTRSNRVTSPYSEVLV
jgi:hypothetical protein